MGLEKILIEQLKDYLILVIKLNKNFHILIESKKLTDDAIKACEITGIKPEDLLEK